MDGERTHHDRFRIEALEKDADGVGHFFDEHIPLFNSVFIARTDGGANGLHVNFFRVTPSFVKNGGLNVVGHDVRAQLVGEVFATAIRFPAAGFSAPAERAVEIEGHVADFAAEVAGAMQDFTVDDDARADASAHREVNEVFSLLCPKEIFS